MPVKTSQRHLDQERDEGRELVLAVVTYSGDRSMYNSTAIRRQGHWPSYSGFQQGLPEVALVPDEGLGYFESHADFEVEYGAEAVADALLRENYLEPGVFSVGRGGSGRQRVLDALDMESVPTSDDDIRDELRSIAGYDEDEDEGGEGEPDLAARLADPDDGYPRSRLKKACAELRDDADDISLQSGKLDFAEWLAGLVEDGDMTETELHDAIRSAGEADDGGGS